MDIDSKLDSLLCVEQVRQVSQSTSMCLMVRSMRSSLICLAALKRTAASWRDPRESAACCGPSSNAGCWEVKCSTSLSTESHDHDIQYCLRCSVSIPRSAVPLPVSCSLQRKISVIPRLLGCTVWRKVLLFYWQEFLVCLWYIFI